MCGIAGVVGEVPNMKSLLKKMSQVQLHRGPDNMGSWISWVVDSEIGMIHNRLAVKQIKGVSEQPYMDEDTGLILVCDGNIYNHVELRKLLSRYYTFHSDTEEEVILKAYHRWGRSCLDRFNGIFAIAIYDRSAKTLFMARDRFGVKPLYFSLQKGNLYFASEIKALFAAGIRKQMSSCRWAGYWFILRMECLMKHFGMKCISFRLDIACFLILHLWMYGNGMNSIKQYSLSKFLTRRQKQQNVFYHWQRRASAII